MTPPRLPRSLPSGPSLRRSAGFTLIELLIVVAIIAILAAVASVNLREARRRSLASACAGNLKTIASGLALYRIDWNHYPLSDGVAGTHDTRTHTLFGNGPAGNGYWNGIPNVLVDLRYVGARKTLFCPALWNEHPGRRENLRYAYNAGALDSNGFIGGNGTPIDGAGAGGHAWVCRCLHVNTRSWNPERYVAFPHGPDPDPDHNTWGSENVLWADFSVTSAAGRAP